MFCCFPKLLRINVTDLYDFKDLLKHLPRIMLFLQALLQKDNIMTSDKTAFGQLLAEFQLAYGSQIDQLNALREGEYEGHFTRQ